MSTTTCPWCEGVLERKPGRGRPSVYCSDRCRRYAYEQRRAAEREGEPVRVVVEKSAPRTVQRTHQAWSRPDPNALAEALEEHPGLAGPVLRRIVQLATNERLSERARVSLGTYLARFITELFDARFAFNPRPATATARALTAEQWGQLAAAGDKITAAERVLDHRERMLTNREEALERKQQQDQAKLDRHAEEISQMHARAREHETQARRIRQRLEAVEAQSRRQKFLGSGSSFHRPSS
jgi:hypothetical protein